MAAPSLTFSLVNGATADASQVMQNFNDLLLGYTDGTKDLSISALTCAGTATLNGSVNIGNAPADELTVTASLASTIPVKTTASYDIGSSTLGLRSIYLGRNSQTVQLIPSASTSATYSLTLPVNAGVNGQVPQTDGSGVLTWVPNMTALVTKSANYTVTTTDGYSTILVTTGASDVTITLPASASSTGRILRIKKMDTGAGRVLIDGNSSETVDGETAAVLYIQYDTMDIQCDGSNWHIIGTHWGYGTYSMTATAGNNVASATGGTCHFSRISKYRFEVSGVVTIDPTSASTAGTEVGLSLPIASNFTATHQCGGAAGMTAGNLCAGGIIADTTNDRASLLFTTSTDTSSRVWGFCFSYTIN